MCDSDRTKLRSACDRCHASKVKCNGADPSCKRCADASLDCHYSPTARIGKPPGSKNRKTLERERLHARGSSASTNGLVLLDDSDYQTHHNTPLDAPYSSLLDNSLEDSFLLPGNLSSYSGILGDYHDAAKDGCTWLPATPTTFLTDSTVGATPTSYSGDERDIVGDFISPEAAAQMNLKPLEPPCSCLRNQANMLCNLQAVEHNTPVVGTEKVLLSMNEVTSGTEAFLRCTRCRNDTRPFLQVVMIFQTIHRWLEAQVASEDSLRYDQSIVMGRYVMSTEDTKFIRVTLLSRAVNKTADLIAKMLTQANQFVATQREQQILDWERTDIEVLRQLTRSLSQTSSDLGERLQALKQQYEK